MREVKRDSSLTLVGDIPTIFTESVSLGIFLWVTVKWKLSTILFICITNFLAFSIYKIIARNKTIYYIKDNILFNHRGIFIKKQIKIPLEKIASVDISQSFKQRLLNLYELNIDRGMVEDMEDIKIILKKDEANDFRNDLLEFNARKENDCEEVLSTENIIYKINFKDLFIYSLVRKPILFAITSIIGLSALLSEVDINFEDVLQYANSIKYIIIAFVVIVILIRLACIIVNLNKFYNFEISRLDNMLDIRYGFTNKKMSSLNLDNICAIKIKQSLLQRFINTSSIHVNTVGYGDNEDEESVLFPNIANKEVDKIIKDLLGRFDFVGEKYSINPRYKLKYKNSALGYNEDLIYISGGILKKSISIISIKEVDSIEYIQNLLHKRNNTFKLKLKYKSMKFGDLNKVSGLDVNHFDDLQNIIENL